MTLATARLAKERQSWRKEVNPPKGFVAKPTTRADGSADLLRWECLVPGKEGTIWEGGEYPVTLQFCSDYPTKPPVCSFKPGFLHPNVHTDGKICLDIINDRANGGRWNPGTTIKMILIGIQELLDRPNINSAAQQRAYELYKRDHTAYEREVRAQAKRHAPVELIDLTL